MTEFKKIGRYVVENLLGEGAMGSVFRAHDPFIKRTVAIKIVKLDASSNEEEAQEFLERFKQEAQISGHLNHPNIVAIYDVGEQDGMPYIAMEYVQGMTLSAYIRQENPPSLGERMKVLTSLAGALDFAHAKGIVHRDLKPANILVQENGTPKIMDFGIAKMSGSNLTQTGVFLGTPSYSSPEQIKEGHVDYRSDIFSLGTLAHETLTEELPFTGQSINAILYKIANEPPNLSAELPGQPIRVSVFREVMFKVLQKDPEQRYQKASDFTSALMGAVKLSQEEQTVVGHLADQLDATVRDVSGVRKNLQRSDFEQARSIHQTTPQLTPEPVKKKGKGGLFVAIILLAVAGTAIYLHLTGELQPMLQDFQKYFEKSKEVVISETDLGEENEEQPPVGEPPKPVDLERTFGVNSQPQGAKVFIDGQEIGPTPATYTWRKPPGAVAELKWVLTNHEDHVQTITMAEDLPGNFTAEMKLKSIQRTITSKPAGATVQSGNSKLGETPLDFSFSPEDKVTLRFSKEGYEPQTISYTEGKSRPGKLDVALKKLPPPGTLSVISFIEGLTIEIDGRRQSGTQFTLRPGKHKIKISAPRFFYEEERTVDIQAGGAEEIRTPDVVSVKKVDFVGSHPYVFVKINGRFVEKGGEHDTTPMSNLRIVLGTHRFEFVDPNDTDNILKKKTIEVKSGEDIIVSSDD
ncbi:MAG: serine/threonine-protein kinase [Acidobacteriota bacterium]|nr:serine/threonine-protein kinase [Acidobacteriota bacterium]